MFTLGVGAMRTPLWARSGSEPQHLALAEMIVVEIGLGTMLFPFLMNDGILEALVTALTTLPFLQLAAFLTATAAGNKWAVMAAVFIWMIGLGTWAAAVQSSRFRLVTIAALNCLVIGGPILTYLIREFSDQADPSAGGILALLDPLSGLLSQGTEIIHLDRALIAPVILLASGGIAMAIRQWKLSRAKLST
jgi:hypothetical protein